LAAKPDAYTLFGMTAMLRTYATFISTLPDDQQEKDGEIVAPGGRNILGRLRDGVTRRGFSASEIEQHEDYGWCFDVIAPACRIWCLIQFCEPWLLITDRHCGLLKRLFGASDDSTHRRVCEAFQEIITADSSFSELHWFTKAEFEGSKGRGGHDKPVE
jgi:hypothetical protein